MGDLPPAAPPGAVFAVILAGGQGTRMMPLSARRPKHLLEVAGEPVLVHQLRWLREHGVRDVVLATGHLSDQVKMALGDGASWGVRLRYSTEDRPLGTGGALRHASRLLNDARTDARVVVVNGDLLTRHDLTAQLDLARGGSVASMAHPPEAVLHLRAVDDPRAFGSVVADSLGRVSAFREKADNSPTREINGGTYVFSSGVIRSIRSGVSSLERDVLPNLVVEAAVRAYREQAFWFDVGTPSDLLRASCATVHDAGHDAWCDATARIDVTAMIAGGSAVGPGATVAAGSSVIASVVMTGATVGPKAVLRRAVVGPGAEVPEFGRVIDGVVA